MIMMQRKVIFKWMEYLCPIKIGCHSFTNDYPTVEKDGDVLNTMCRFKITDFNEDFKLVHNIKTKEEVEEGLYSEDEKNLMPDEYRESFILYDIWDRHSCKLFSNIAIDSNRGYIGNTSINIIPIKYFKIKSTDKKFYIDFYNSRNINCPSVIPYMKNKNKESSIQPQSNKDILTEPFVIELQLMQNEKLLYI